ncbi:HAD-IA family hydrolase [Pseudoduganella namucuonensis]|uniref:Putative hydrolase of the HAD superfamily n=1 Tax=Pseudoduganella namucuonensis TaxID=1035707 RepID=A0A1I7GA43_9BURK|nr:HAD-IA family hydrolase [Pseudoduganella namucuonensis]SFU45304.1 putative hydrolase of the HAD superfamily [Pseudoduganella namucuonensis]
MHIKPSAPVWLFDLDNTLHNASHAIFPAITARMNTYIARVLGDGVTPASDEVVNAARKLYWTRYGATMLGLVKHHGVRSDHFLRETHDMPGLGGMVRAERGLKRLLRALPGRKVLLTNAPRRYSREVLRHLGLHRHFSHHVAIESMHVHRQLRPKPSRLMLRKLMRSQRLTPRRCILVEDTLANLRAARQLGMRTAWVTQYLTAADPIAMAHLPKRLNRPAWVDVKVKSVRHLPARLSRLR